MTTIDNEPLKEWLAAAIAYIIETRERMKRPPYMAKTTNIMSVLVKNVEKTLAEMTKEGLLTERHTLNENAYEFSPSK